MRGSAINAILSTPRGLTILAVLFVPLWCATCFYVSWVSGWLVLARRFRTQSEAPGEVRTTGSILFMRFWSHYGSVVRLIGQQDAMYASVFFLFRIGHPPLRIPWDEIRFDRTRFFFRTYCVLTLGNEEKIPMRISVRMARNLGILDRYPAS